MKAIATYFVYSILWFGLCLPVVLSAQEAADAEGVEILARGPVHEAFAEPLVFDPEPSGLVAKQPPEPVEELPPEEKPAGENITWIPGYWSWDDDRTDFLWISGFWRSLPPNREWVPGYWQAADGGWRWVAGYWAKADEEEVEFLPPPPKTLEAGPSIVQPTVNHLWIPGCWQWTTNRYAWRPGYWYVAQANWLWVPAHYVWTPRGYVFVGGYWDYPMANRGLLYAPVCFHRPIYTQPSYRYCPQVAIDINLCSSHFFVRPSHGHYYFGDYYAANYVSLGIVPWFSPWNNRRCYDPLFTHHSHHQHQLHPQVDYIGQMQKDYEFRRQHQEARPAHIMNWADIKPGTKTVVNVNALVKPVQAIAATPNTNFQLEKLNTKQRDDLAKVAHATRQFTLERGKLEKMPQVVNANVNRDPPDLILKPRDNQPRDNQPRDSQPALEIAPKKLGEKPVEGQPLVKEIPFPSNESLKFKRPKSPVVVKTPVPAVTNPQVQPRVELPKNIVGKPGDKLPVLEPRRNSENPDVKKLFPNVKANNSPPQGQPLLKPKAEAVEIPTPKTPRVIQGGGGEGKPKLEFPKPEMKKFTPPPVNTNVLPRNNPPPREDKVKLPPAFRNEAVPKEAFKVSPPPTVNREPAPRVFKKDEVKQNLPNFIPPSRVQPPVRNPDPQPRNNNPRDKGKDKNER